MIRLENVSKYYHQNGGVTRALDRINASFRRGEFIVVTGESGSGKSTFLNVVSGLDRYESGEMYIDGKETSYYSESDFEDYRRDNVAFIFQDYNIIDAYTVYENVDVALMIGGVAKKDRRKRIKSIIDRVGLTPQTHQKTSKLSGGEKQRVAIARALAKDAPLIVADEPTGNLDKNTSEKILKLLKELSEDKLVLLVSHSYEVAKNYASRHIRLFDGKIIEDKTFEELPTHEKLGRKTSDHAFLTPKSLVTIAGHNLKAMPKRTLFVLALSLLIVLSFAFTYGSYVEQTHARAPGGHPHFRNVSEGRIVVNKASNTPMDASELETLGNLRGVQAVLPYDTILDQQFSIHVDNGGYGGPMRGYFRTTNVNHAAMLRSRDLIDGRLPENANEVVVNEAVQRFAYNDALETIQLNFEVRFQYMEYLDLETFDVVGTVSSDRTAAYFNEVYFHEDFFARDRVKTAAMKPYHDIRLTYDGTERFLYQFDMMMESGVSEGKVEVSPYFVNELLPDFDEEDVVGTVFTLKTNDVITGEAYSIDVEVAKVYEFEEQTGRALISIHPDTLYELYADIDIHQVSLIVHDRFTAHSVIDSIDDDAYGVVYPAEYEDSFNRIFRIIGQIMQGVASVALLVVLYFLAFLALRNVMQARTKDFVILRSLGAKQKDIHRISVLEMCAVMALSLLIVFVLMLINSAYRTPIPDYIPYLRFSNYVLMVVVLLTLSVLLALRFNQKIYAVSVNKAFKEGGEIQ